MNTVSSLTLTITEQWQQPHTSNSNFTSTRQYQPHMYKNTKNITLKNTYSRTNNPTMTLWRRICRAWDLYSILFRRPSLRPRLWPFPFPRSSLLGLTPVFHGKLHGPHSQGSHVAQAPIVARLFPGFRGGKEVAKALPSLATHTHTEVEVQLDLI